MLSTTVVILFIAVNFKVVSTYEATRPPCFIYLCTWDHDRPAQIPVLYPHWTMFLTLWWCWMLIKTVNIPWWGWNILKWITDSLLSVVMLQLYWTQCGSCSFWSWKGRKDYASLFHSQMKCSWFQSCFWILWVLWSLM